MDNEFLCFIKFIGTDIDGMYMYEFLFTQDTETFWGENFEYMPCCLCNELVPNDDAFDIVKRVRMRIKLSLVTESCCNSMQDCMDGIIALAWEDISEYEEYPEKGRLILQYGMTYDDVEDELAKRNVLMYS